MIPPKQILSMRRKLLRWYEKTHRDLPWRRTRDPYAIWIAETMLQQTQVATVTRYYDRFLNAFPTIQALHRARLSRVLTLWSGLGYYRRAVNLKKSARVLMRDHGGSLPDNYTALRNLPGVGDYTAGAVLSIAFGKRFPAVDGNARRVIGRAFARRTEKEIRDLAARLVPPARAGYFNQGLMEIGATVCAPRDPLCRHCPWRDDCKSASDSITKPWSKSQILRSVTWPLAIVRNGSSVLVRRRPGNGVLSGLWEFPGSESEPGETPRANLQRHLKILPKLPRPKQIGQFQHAITKRKIRAPVFLFDNHEWAGFSLPNRSWRWLNPDSLRRYPVSSMTLKAAKVLATYEDGAV
ncbi:MAG TPA: A/G-specific adenine glycosylase [Candidatus Binatia bacterium]